MQQHDGRPLASDADVKRRTIGLDVLRSERNWKRLNLCCYRQCQGDCAERASNEPEHLLSPIVDKPITILDAQRIKLTADRGGAEAPPAGVRVEHRVRPGLGVGLGERFFIGRYEFDAIAEGVGSKSPIEALNRF